MPDKLKTAEFFNAINADLNRQVKAIMTEADEIKETQIRNYTEEAKRNSNAFYRHEVAKITQSSGRKLALAQADIKKEKLEKRNEIAENVFKKVADKLISFTKSEDYAAFLVKSAVRIASHFNGGEILFYLKESDLELAPEISRAVVQQCRFEADPLIKIGGCKAVSSSSALAADDTLDCRLDEQRRWFYENSGLSV